MTGAWLDIKPCPAHLSPTEHERTSMILDTQELIDALDELIDAVDRYHENIINLIKELKDDGTECN